MVEVLVWFIMAECVVKKELTVINILGDPINFVLRLMTYYLRVRAWHDINFSFCQLLLEDRSLFDTNIQLKAVAWLVLDHERNVFFLSLNKLLEVNVDLPAVSLILLFPLFSVLFDVFHAPSSLLPIELDLLYFIGAWWAFLHFLCWLVVNILVHNVTALSIPDVGRYHLALWSVETWYNVNYSTSPISEPLTVVLLQPVFSLVCSTKCG